MCQDFIPNRGNLVSEQRYDDGDVCDDCIKSDKVVKRLQKDIEHYQNRIVDYKMRIRYLESKNSLIEEGCDMIKKFIKCITCGLIALTGLLVINAFLNLVGAQNVPEVNLIILLLSFLGASLGYSLTESDFIDTLVRMFIMSREENRNDSVRD